MSGATSPIVGAVVAALAVLGATAALIGSIGLLRMPTFYERVHPPTLGTTLGVAFIVTATILLFSVTGRALALHAILVAVFAIVTTPVTYMLLVRAAVHRDGKPGNTPDPLREPPRS